MKNALPIFAFALAAACGSRDGAPAVQAPADQGAEVNAVADAYLEAIKETIPFEILFSGLGEDVPVANDAFDRNAPESDAAFEKIEDDLLARINAIDPAALTQRADWVAHQTLKSSLEASVGARVCHQSWWSLNHMFGWQNGMPVIASMQPVATPQERAAALARWEKLPAFIAQDRANLETGLANGYSVPKRVVARVIAQLDALIAAPAADSPFIAFPDYDDADFKAKAEALAAEKINPAIAEFRAFLNDVYMPQARDALAITALPDGAACYEAMLRAYHTADIGAKRTHEHGKEAVAANTQKVIALGQAKLGTSDCA